MRRKLIWLGLFSAAILVTALNYPKVAQATPADGFTGTTIALGRFGPINVFNYFIPPNIENDKHKKQVWLSLQRTRGQSDLYVQNNVWVPGGSTGWHSHPGHSLIIVTAGTVTEYESDDHKCKPHVSTQGMGFIDPGGDHVHILRNEGTVNAQTIAVQLIPADQPRRIDVADPGNCSF